MTNPDYTFKTGQTFCIHFLQKASDARAMGVDVQPWVIPAEARDKFLDSLQKALDSGFYPAYSKKRNLWFLSSSWPEKLEWWRTHGEETYDNLFIPLKEGNQ